MKKLLLLLLLLFSKDAECQLFSSDRTVFDSASFEVSENFLQVAFNDWIYVGFNYYNQPFRGYRVVLSKDLGNSWQTLIDFNVPGASGWYPQIDEMLVAGTDTANLRIFLALSGSGNGGPEVLGAISAFDGLTGADVGTSVTLGDFVTYGISDISLAADYVMPMSVSSPYSVFATYAVSNGGGLDSICYIYSNDGGLNFTGHQVIETDSSADYREISTAYGAMKNPASGTIGFTYMKGNSLMVAFTDTATAGMVSSIMQIDTLNTLTSGNCSKPEIAIQFNEAGNLNSDITTFIVAEAIDQSDSASAIVSFYNTETFGNGLWNMDVVDSSSHSITPEIMYDSLTSHIFWITYYDTLNKALPLFLRPADATGNPLSPMNAYADTLSFHEPNPQLGFMYGAGINTSIACSWKQKSDSSILSGIHQSVKFTMGLLAINIEDVEGGTNLKAYPNPASNEMLIEMNSDWSKPIQIQIRNVLGTLVKQVKPDGHGKTLTRIDISNLTPGIYWLTVISETKSESVKFVVQR